MVARIDDPAEWAGKAESPRVQWELARLMLVKNDYNGATPLLAELVASTDAEAKPFQPEAHYWLGVARFKGNEFAAAADEFDAALAAPGDWAKEARYLRFKALEALMAKEATVPLAERYVAALTEFVTQSPDHPMIAEGALPAGRVPAGERAVPAGDRGVRAGQRRPGLRAARALRHAAEPLRAAEDRHRPAGAQGAARRDRQGSRRAVAAERRRSRQRRRARDVALQELEAKATLLQAVYLSLQGDGGDEKIGRAAGRLRHSASPQQTDLVPQAVRLRLGALLQLGQFADAEQTVQQNAAALAKENRRDAVEGLAVGYAKAGSAPQEPGRRGGGRSASRVALGALSGARRRRRQRRRQAAARGGAAARIDRQLGGRGDDLPRRSCRRTATRCVALRGLAQAEAEQGKTADALAHWAQYTEKSRPGDPGWFQGQYEQARCSSPAGDKQKSCELLTKLRPSMPGLTDAELRGQFDRAATSRPAADASDARVAAAAAC